MALSDLLAAMFAPWTKDSPDLEGYVRTIGEMFDPLEIYVSDQDDGTPGYTAMLDPDAAPLEALPWLAQFVGERLPLGLSDDAARRWIKGTPNQLRGTKVGVARAAMNTLTGSKTVMMHPRAKLDGTVDPDYLTVITLDSETPHPDRTEQAILDNMEADVVLDYAHVTGTIWANVAALGTWANVAAEGMWADVANLMPTSGGSWYVFDTANTETYP